LGQAATANLFCVTAYQCSEQGSKGSIEPGKLADLVILSGNPLTVPPDNIKDIKVVETIKEGKSIYKRPL
jgi:predicted amidohydrolase YtcJ